MGRLSARTGPFPNGLATAQSNLKQGPTAPSRAPVGSDVPVHGHNPPGPLFVVFYPSPPPPLNGVCGPNRARLSPESVMCLVVRAHTMGGAATAVRRGANKGGGLALRSVFGGGLGVPNARSPCHGCRVPA